MAYVGARKEGERTTAQIWWGQDGYGGSLPLDGSRSLFSGGRHTPPPPAALLPRSVALNLFLY